MVGSLRAPVLEALPYCCLFHSQARSAVAETVRPSAAAGTRARRRSARSRSRARRRPSRASRAPARDRRARRRRSRAPTTARTARGQRLQVLQHACRSPPCSCARAYAAPRCPITTGLFSESGSARVELGDRVVVPAVLAERDAEAAVRRDGVGVELERLAELRDRFGVLPGVEQIPAEVAVDDRRQRIEIERARTSVIASARRPSVARYIAYWLCASADDGLSEMPCLNSRSAAGQSQSSQQLDVAERDVRLGQVGIELQRLFGRGLRLGQRLDPVRAEQQIRVGEARRRPARTSDPSRSPAGSTRSLACSRRSCPCSSGSGPAGRADRPPASSV